MSEESIFFIGIDPIDPFAERKRPCARAILESNLRCEFDEWQYDKEGTAIIPPKIASFTSVLAIDGPQGLAGRPTQNMRACERNLGAAGKSPYDLPELRNSVDNRRPYAGFVLGSVELFYSLYKSKDFHIFGMQEYALSRTNLIEVYPGTAWPVLFKQPNLAILNSKLANKKTLEGRRIRYRLLSNQGVVFDPKYSFEKPPTHDELDAALAGYTAYLFRNGKTCSYGNVPFEDVAVGLLREGLIVQPCF